MWLVEPLFDTTLVVIDLYIINPGYLKDGPTYFTKLLDNGMEKLNKMFVKLNIIDMISEINN